LRVEFVRVEKRFSGEAAALRGVSFEVPSGQICVLLGPSGAGKSTLLRCINGLTVPSGGKVLVDGLEVTRRALPALRHRIGMVHQSFALTPRLSVARNVLAGALADVSTAAAWLGLFRDQHKRRAASLIAAVGLGEQHLARRVADLSGGQQQRVGIARALMTAPALILADEPVASLDPRTGADILALLANETRRRSATLICSLHQVELARGVADRIIALSGGEVVFDGPPWRLNDADLARIYGAGDAASAA
jgi:phosphonate transport system ATP-binding protein